MTGDRLKLINYVDKFIGTVRFRNDEFATIVGYGDYKLQDTVITRVYYVEGLKHNLFSVGQFCDAGLEVAFRQPRMGNMVLYGNPDHKPLGKYVAKKTAVPNSRLERPQLISESYRSYFNFHLITVLNPQTLKIEAEIVIFSPF
nr:integrase, catalytic region, zinc finger, CCHC-type, peptidase aspartic, catalytic [Tanacetum cinerariifolium]